MSSRTSEARISSAVQTKPVSTLLGLQQKLFAAWFGGFVYNQVWEDPLVDIEALEIGPDSRVLTIASGGCNALNYLLSEPASVTAVDLNHHHIRLLELKAAAAATVPSFEDFFSMFGHGWHVDVRRLFDGKIATALSDEARLYWSSNSALGRMARGRRIGLFDRPGLYDRSRNGRFLKAFHGFAHILGCRPELIVTAKTRAEQTAIYSRHIEPFFNNLLFRIIGRMPVTMFGLGIPPQQFARLKDESNCGENVVNLYRERVRQLACNFPIEDNYFAWQAFARKYDTEHRKALPEYLKAVNFDRLRSALPKLRTAIGHVTQIVSDNPKNSFNSFVLLDAQDWMDKESVVDLWTVIANRAEPGSRLIFRTAGTGSPVEGTLPPNLMSRFVYERERSGALAREDRCTLYGGFHLYRLLPEAGS